jgi:hypothetical protein
MLNGRLAQRIRGLASIGSFMAKDIVDTLEAQHRSLEQMAGALTVALKKGDTETARTELLKLCSLLEAHIQIENAQFYPALVKGAEWTATPQIADMAKMFQSNMQLIAEGVLRFCTRWRGGIADVPAFAKEWKSTIEVLGKRMLEEERTLHPMFRKHAIASPA